MPPLENENLQGLQAATESFKKSVATVGFDKGGAAKTLEYLERTSKAIADAASGRKGEDPDSIKASLKQFSKIDFDSLQAAARTLKEPASWEWISDSAVPKYNYLGEYALATRAVPENQRHTLDPKVVGDMTITSVNGETVITFGAISGLAFSPEKILAGCLTSKDKKTFYYAHYSPDGKLKSTTAFEATPAQFYLIERTAREALAQKGELKKLYPDKVIDSKRWGRTRVSQGPDGTITATHEASGQTVQFKDGFLDFPMDNMHSLDIFRRDTAFTAEHSSNTKAMIVGDQLLDMLIRPENFPDNGVDTKDIALITARHELNHAIWEEQNDSFRKSIMDYFTLADPGFARFTNTLLENDGYRDAAINDAKRQNQETLTVNFKGQQIVVGKERIVNELLAYATWTEIVDQSVIDKIKAKNPLMPLSAEVISRLSTEKLQELRSKLLSGDRNSGFHERYFQSFLTAAKILDSKRK